MTQLGKEGLYGQMSALKDAQQDGYCISQPKSSDASDH